MKTLTRLEELVLQLWVKGEAPCLIALETRLDQDVVEDIIEDKSNYPMAFGYVEKG